MLIKTIESAGHKFMNKLKICFFFPIFFFRELILRHLIIHYAMFFCFNFLNAAS